MTTTQLFAKEGLKGGIVLGVCLFVCFILGLNFFALLLLAMLLFWIFIFRNPERLPNERVENILLSPCDGKIEDIEYIHGGVLLTFRVGIMDVGILRAPLNLNEQITQEKRNGLRLYCFEDDYKERLNSKVFLETSVFSLQIIPEIFDAKVYPLSEIKRGDRIGFCKMGILKMKIILNTVELKLNIGDIVRGGETILGYVK